MTECGIVEITDSDGKVTRYPAYGCGHCSDTVVMHPQRARPRLTCIKCSRWLCEKKELCQAECTPIYSLADDHMEASDKWTKYVPALMAGLTTKQEAQNAGLIKEF
jgi:hypothetical protein